MKNRFKKLMIIAMAVVCVAAISQTATAAAKATKANDYKQGKVYRITPASGVAPGSNYNKSSTYNKYTKHYFVLRSYMDKFQKAKKGTLILGKGTYSLTNTVQVPSNVTIILEDGAKLVKGNVTKTGSMPASKTFFHLIKPSNRDRKNVYGKHNGEKNIHFVGKGSATMDLKYIQKGIGIVMGHNMNVTVEGINFKNLNTGHFIEMDASKNVIVDNCTFANVKKGSDYVKEAINIDTPDSVTQGFNNAWSKHDKTPNENVIISNCKFTKLGRAIGTHKYSVKGGKTQVYHSNIKLSNLTITESKYDSPIRIINWKDSVVENCKIINVYTKKGASSRGILATGIVNVSIKNNYFENMNRPIQIFPWKNIGTGEKYPTTYNKISAANKNDLKTNYGTKLGEYFTRINDVYNVFTYAEQIGITEGKTGSSSSGNKQTESTPAPTVAPTAAPTKAPTAAPTQTPYPEMAADLKDEKSIQMWLPGEFAVYTTDADGYDIFEYDSKGNKVPSAGYEMMNTQCVHDTVNGIIDCVTANNVIIYFPFGKLLKGEKVKLRIEGSYQSINNSAYSDGFRMWLVDTVGLSGQADPKKVLDSGYAATTSEQFKFTTANLKLDSSNKFVIEETITSTLDEKGRSDGTSYGVMLKANTFNGMLANLKIFSATFKKM